MELKPFYKYTNAKTFKIKSYTFKNSFKTNLQSGFSKTGWYFCTAFVRKTFVWTDSFRCPIQGICLIYSKALPEGLPAAMSSHCHWCPHPSGGPQDWGEALALLCRWAWLQIIKSEQNFYDVPEEMHLKSRGHNFLSHHHHRWCQNQLQVIQKSCMEPAPGHTSPPLVPWPQTSSGEKVLYLGLLSEKFLVYLFFCFITFCHNIELNKHEQQWQRQAASPDNTKGL